MQAVILTTCWNIKLLHGATLTFKTLRTGFPTTRVTVIDNASVLEAREPIKELAAENNCEFTQFTNRVEHWQFLNWVVDNFQGTVIVLDPDLIFWGTCEGWDFSNYLFAGRYIPTFYDPYTQTYTEQRVHPSFLWIRDIEQLRTGITMLQLVEGKALFSPFGALKFKDGDRWRFFDTGTGLYSAFKDKAYPFTENELNCYEHLLLGSLCSGTLRDKNEFISVWDIAKADYRKLKGLYKLQNKFFKKYSLGKMDYNNRKHRPISSYEIIRL